MVVFCVRLSISRSVRVPPIHVLVHCCSETWAKSIWGIYENPAPAAQQLLLVFWKTMTWTCNILIVHRMRNIKVRFRIRLRLELRLGCGTKVDVVFREVKHQCINWYIPSITLLKFRFRLRLGLGCGTMGGGGLTGGHGLILYHILHKCLKMQCFLRKI